MSDPDLDLSALGAALVSLRTQRGMTRRDLAEASGLSYPYVAELEKGRKNPSARALAALAAALDVQPLELQAFAEGRAAVEDIAMATLAGPRVASPAPPTPRLHDASPGRSDSQDDLVDRITASVVQQLGPVIRDTVERALREAGDT